MWSRYFRSKSMPTNFLLFLNATTPVVALPQKGSRTISPSLLVDLGLMEMTINNLLNNALKYSSAAVHINVRQPNDHVLIEIVDQGIGIPAADLAHVFDRFYRADNVKGLAGTGIGLHLCLQIMKLHGGSLTVVSTENIGSTFTILLPVPQPSA